MQLDEAYSYLNFWINKAQGGWYSPEELDMIVDRAQMSLFNDYYTQFGASQRVNDALSPFVLQYQFTNITSPTGLVQMPDDYQQLLSIYTITQNSVTGLPQNNKVVFLNYDEKAQQDKSQINPPGMELPYGILLANWDVQLYPATAQAGIVFYLRRPVAPSFSYTIVGRTVEYLPNSSQQLEWADKDQNSILIKALNSLGINLSEADVLQWSEQKDQMNINSPKDKI